MTPLNCCSNPLVSPLNQHKLLFYLDIFLLALFRKSGTYLLSLSSAAPRLVEQFKDCKLTPNHYLPFSTALESPGQ